MKRALLIFAAAVAGLFIVIFATYFFTGDATTAGNAGGLYIVPWMMAGIGALFRSK